MCLLVHNGSGCGSEAGGTMVANDLVPLYLEPSRMAEAASGHNPGTAGESDVI